MATINTTLRPEQDYRGNLYGFGSVALGLASWATLPPLPTSTPELIVPTAFGIGAVIGAVHGVHAVWNNYLLRKGWEQAQTPFQEKDDRLMNEAERIETGMRDGVGRILGATFDHQPLFLPHRRKPAFEINLGGQGTGKTTTGALLSAILTPLTSGKGVFINDIKKEIMPQVIAALKRFGVEVVCINIGAEAQDICPGEDVPPFELAIDAYYSNDPEFHQLTTMFIRAYAEIAVEIPEDAGKASFFFENGQLVFEVLFVYLMRFEPEDVTPTRIWMIASDMELAVKCFNRLLACSPKTPDDVLEDAKKGARSILDMHEGKPEYLPQFLNKVKTGLKCYSVSGPLGHFGRGAVARISDLRKKSKKPFVIASMMPLRLIKDTRVHTSFLAYNFFMSAKAFPHGRRVHGLIDEFTTLNLPDFADEMLTLRGLGVSAEMYIQSLLALMRRIGELAAKTIWEQSDIIQMSGIGEEDATKTSEMLGTVNKRQQSANVRGSRFEDVGFDFRDHEVPLYSPQELMALPLNQQIVKLRGYRPDVTLKVPYWDIAGLKELVAENPLEGPPPKTKPKFDLKITKDSVKVLWWRKPKGYKKAKPTGPKKEWVVRPSSFLWLYAWLAVFAAGGFSVAKPEPHFYFKQTSQGCEYLSIRGVWRVKPDSKCRPIWIRREGR
ncbi:MAG: type IV secretory system conjugative DNA transfer family protein [Pseudomonadota bacterium]